MKLKDKIIKNRVGILIFIGVLLVVTIIIGISYAYFFNIEIKNNNTISGNINTKYYTFESSGNSTLSLTINQSDLDMANASNDYSSFVSGNGGNINVSLNTNGLKKVYCSYDLVYEPVSAYTPNSGAVSAGLKEFTLSGTSDKENSFSEIDVSGSSTVTLISGIKISTDTNILEKWSFTAKYYNLDVIQDNVVGKTFKGNIKVANTDCSFNEPVSGTSFETLMIENNTDIFNENGIRYEGADPKNYICLDSNKEGACSSSSLLFRIIGLFEEEYSSDGTSSTGTKKLLKVIDTNNYGGASGNSWNETEISGKNYNDWSTSALKTKLNGPYLSTLLATSGVNSKLSSAIVNAKWHLGGVNNTSSSNYYYRKITTEDYYKAERSPYATSGTLQNLLSGNPEYVFAKVGLMYPSDYGYATVGGSTTNKSSCREKELYNWYISSYSDCKDNDWIFKSATFIGDGEWFISPSASLVYGVSHFDSTSCVYDDYSAGYSLAVRPTFYLDSSILKIVGTGDGTKDNAYRIG
ncbi:MAG: hypothetical protein SPE00_04950 [Bacilli bacterium]|nr:hypothetical protein [Bacilli bacterium]